jgi:hypothetical protein
MGQADDGPQLGEKGKEWPGETKLSHGGLLKFMRSVYLESSKDIQANWVSVSHVILGKLGFVIRFIGSDTGYGYQSVADQQGHIFFVLRKRGTVF